MTNSNVAIATTIAYSDDFGRLSVIYVDHQSSARIRCVCVYVPVWRRLIMMMMAVVVVAADMV